jgi:glucose-6-phosphate isomerase
MSIHLKRVESLIKKNLMEIITYKLKDPNVGFVAINDVKVSSDLSYAKVFCSFLGSKNYNEAGIKALNNAKGYLRSELSKTLDTRKTPELSFIIDDSLDQGRKIEGILKRVIKEDKMINLNLDNIIQDVDFEAYADKVKEIDLMINEGTGAGGEFCGWTSWPFEYDKEEVERIKKTAARLREISDVIVIMGIGGSYLGAKSAIDMIKGHLSEDKPEIMFAGISFSGREYRHQLQYLEGKDVSLICISKSGSTTETSACFRLFRQYVEKRYGKQESIRRIAIVTDKQKGLLKPLCDEWGYDRFVIPDEIGGRFSVITPVGLLPMACAGIDIDEFIRGIQDSAKKYDNSDIMSNDAYKYAVVRNEMMKSGRTNEVYVTYEPDMDSFGEWLKQLFGESEGKDGKGIFPATIVCTRDLHSLGQFIQQGNNQILFETVLNIENPVEDMEFPYDQDNDDNMNYLSGRSLNWINKQAFMGTLKAHVEDGKVPNVVISLKDDTCYSCAYAMYFFFKALAMSAYMLGVNPFDQPGVEIYKNNMYELLGKPKK